MTVKELMNYLKLFPADMEIVETRYSDLDLMEIEDWSLVKAIDTKNKRGYITYYPENDWRLTDSNYKKQIESIGQVKTYLHFKGN